MITGHCDPGYFALYNPGDRVTDMDASWNVWAIRMPCYCQDPGTMWSVSVSENEFGTSKF